MRRTLATVGAPRTEESTDPRPPLQTEFSFELPRGYVDATGQVHTAGVMRMATARDELVPLRDGRVRDNPSYLSVILLARVITRLGDVTDVDAEVVEDMFASDVAYLQDLYRQVNAEGHTHVGVSCPSCEHDFSIDIAGSRLGES